MGDKKGNEKGAQEPKGGGREKVTEWERGGGGAEMKD
jgi:hypothetical protein